MQQFSVTFADRPGTTEDLFVQKELGQGKVPVYQAYSTSRRQQYAVKLFPKTSYGATQYKKEKLMFRFNHPNIIQRISLICHDQNAYALFTEIAKNGDFFAAVTKGMISNEIIARTYFKQLIEGIEYIHAQGVAHLDLKLENMMLNADFQLKIIDFDQCQLISDKKCSSYGTVCYRAPEVQAGDCTNLTAADVFSAGILLFTFLAKEFPFTEDDDSSYKNIRRYPTFLYNNKHFWAGKAEKKGTIFSQDFIELVNGMLRKDVNNRLTIQQIKESRWYQGPVMNYDELKNEMRFKHEVVLNNEMVSF